MASPSAGPSIASILPLQGGGLVEACINQLPVTQAL
jgi:hypothetical protein